MQHPQKEPRKPRTNSQKRKALYLALPLVLALAFVLLLPAVRHHFPATPGGVPILPQRQKTLSDTHADQLLSITVTQREGESYTLLYQNEQLYLQKNDSQIALKDDMTQRILHNTTLIVVEDIVTEDMEEVRPHLSDMGLEPPEITVRVVYRNGQEDVLQIGGPVPDSTFYYYRWSGAEQVFMCDRGTHELFSAPASLLLPVDQPVFDKNLITSMTLHPRGQEPMEIQFTADTSGVVSGTLLAPFSYPLSAEATANLITAAVNFRLGSPQGAVTPENQGDYGFDDPLAMIDIRQKAGVYSAIDETGAYVSFEAEEETLRMELGRKEGEYFYTCHYNGQCYYVSHFLIAPLVAATPETIITQNPAYMGDTALASIQIQSGGRLLDFRQQRTERVLPNNQLDTDENGAIRYDITTTRNGEPIGTAAFEALVERLSAMKVSGDADPGFSIGTAMPHWQLTLTTVGGTVRTVTAYPKDAFFDVVAINGMARHTLQAESLEAALAELGE